MLRQFFVLCFLCASLCFATSRLVAKEDVRYVIANEALVYSGPNDSLYATSKLAKGAMVEVYHETNDGWVGIRPPAGSFDWVAADAGHLLSEGKVLQIVGRATPAWIGTYESIARSDLKWQIELQPSQKLNVIGEALQPSKVSSESKTVKTWFKIQPPQGEFRWMHANQLSLTPISPNDPSINRTSKVVSSVAKQVLEDSDASAYDQDFVVQASAVTPRSNRSGSHPSVVRKAVAQTVSPLNSSNSKETDLGNADELPPPKGSNLSHGNGDRSLLSKDASAKGEAITLGPTPMSSKMPPEFVEGGIHLGNMSGVGSEDFVLDGELVEGQIVDGQIIEGDMIHGDFASGEVVMDGETLPCNSCGGGEACGTCGGCNACDECSCSHQTDSFKQWEAMGNSSNPKLRVHPIGRILGLIGLTVSEAEVVHPDASCATCSSGGVMEFGAHPAGPSPRYGNRFEHLPRPGRRLRSSLGAGWLGSNETLGAPYASTQSQTSFTNHEPLGDRSWNIRANAPAATPTLATLEPLRGVSNGISNFGQSDIALVGNADLDSLQFSTPEIQRAMVNLSAIVSQPMNQWALIGPMNEAKNWIQTSVDPIARGEARLLLDRIEGFEGLRQRSVGMNNNTAMSGMPASSISPEMTAANSTSNSSVRNPISFAGFQRPAADIASGNPLDNNPGSSQTNASSTLNVDGTPASDASGWLVEVFSKQPGLPEFALTDDAGGLIAYVVAPPGLNLRRYLKQPVGIYGVKGYLPNLSARQITAERVVRIR